MLGQNAPSLDGRWDLVSIEFMFRSYARLICYRGLDFTPTNIDSFKDDAPLIVLLHGLSGGLYFHNNATLDPYTHRL